MIGERPDFMDSPYFVAELGNWHLLPGAPEEVVKEFEEYMKQYDEAYPHGCAFYYALKGGDTDEKNKTQKVRSEQC